MSCVVDASPTFFLPIDGMLYAFLLPAVCWSCSMLCAILCASLLPVVSVIGSHLMGPFCIVAHVFPILVLRFGPWSPVCEDHIFTGWRLRGVASTSLICGEAVCWGWKSCIKTPAGAS